MTTTYQQVLASNITIYIHSHFVVGYNISKQKNKNKEQAGFYILY
jgi:hypothetical protein